MPFRMTTLTLIIVLALLSPCAAANPDPGLVARLSYLNTETGLSDDLILAMVQDKDGFVWIGTNAGLDRYDGTRIRNFNAELLATGKLALSSVSSLLNDEQGRLWVGTWGAGLFRYEPATETFTRLAHEPGNPRSLQSNYIDSLAALPGGRIAVGSQAGVDVVSANGVGVERLAVDGEDSARDLRVRHLLADSTGTLWIATRSGLFMKAPRMNIRRYSSADHAILSGNIYTLIEDGGQALLLGTADGIWRLEANGALSRYLPAGLDPQALDGVRITAMARTRNGDLLIGTLERGALLEQMKRGRTRAFSQQPPAPYGIPDDQVASLLETADHTLWIGTLTRGIARASATALALEHYIAVPGGGLPDSRINAVAALGETLWVATETELARFNPESGRFTRLAEAGDWRYPAGLSGILRVISSGDQFWMHNDTALFRMDPAARRIEPVALLAPDGKPVHSFLTGLREGPAGFLWISWYESMLTRLDPETGEQRLFRITDPDDGAALFVFSVNAHPLHGVVVLTNRGVLRIGENGQGNGWLVKDETDRINDIFFETNGDFWLAAASGAQRYSRSGERRESVTQESGLPHDDVQLISRDRKNRLWFATRRGVAVRNPRSATLQTFRARDGLQADFINAMEFLPNEKTAIAGPNGLNVFDVNAVIDTHHPAALRVSSIEVFSADGTITRLPATRTAVVLEPEQEHLRVQFSLLDFSDPERHHYEYRVLGSNDQWNSLEGTPRIMLQQIEPGSYVLELRAVGPHGIPAANGVSLAIEAKPHWYESLIAKIFYVLAALCPFALLAWLAVRYVRTGTYLDAERHRRRLLEAMYQLATTLTECESENAVAQKILTQLHALTPFRHGALYFRKGEVLSFSGAVSDTADWVQRLEQLPAYKPRLLARISVNEGPLPLLTRDIDANAAMADAFWLGVPAFSRDGAAAILLIGRDTAWGSEDHQLLNAVLRQVVHGLDLSAIRTERRFNAHHDYVSGLLNRDAFLASAAHVTTFDTASGNPAWFMTLDVVPPREMAAANEDAAIRVTLARIAQRLLAQIGPNDVAGRLAAHRFALLLADVSANDVNRLTASLNASIAGVEWPNSNAAVAVVIQARKLNRQRAMIDQLTEAFTERA